MASFARTALTAFSRVARQSSIPTRTVCTSLTCRTQPTTTTAQPETEDVLVDLEKAKAAAVATAEIVAAAGGQFTEYALRLPLPPHVLLDEELFDNFFLQTANRPQAYEELMFSYGIEDPFEYDTKAMAPGSKSFPHLVPTTATARWAGCFCSDDDPYATWMMIHVGESKRCSCGSWFRCLDYPSFLLAQSEQVQAMHDAGLVNVHPNTLQEAAMVTEIISNSVFRGRLEKWIAAGAH